MTDLQLEAMKYDFQVIMVWSFPEAGRYLRTLKAYENRPKAQLKGNQRGMTENEKIYETLGSLRRLANKDAGELLSNYGCLKDIILCEDYNEFTNIAGISDAKVESLTACFRGNMSTD